MLTTSDITEAQKIERIFEEGVAAGYDGAASTRNPYYSVKAYAQAWGKGYKVGCELAEEELYASEDICDRCGVDTPIDHSQLLDNGDLVCADCASLLV